MGSVTVAIGALLAFVPGDDGLAEFTYRSVEALLGGQAMPKPAGKAPAQGVFVTIEIAGKVGGCRGTLDPTELTLEREIQKAVRSGALFDPRYGPVRLKGREFKVTLTIVDRLVPVGDIGTLRPEDGLVLRANGRTGIVLPWEGKDPHTRLRWAYMKAGVRQGTSAQIEILKAQRYRYPEEKKR